MATGATGEIASHLVSAILFPAAAAAYDGQVQNELQRGTLLPLGPLFIRLLLSSPFFHLLIRLRR